MIWTENAANFLKDISEYPNLTLDSLSIKAGESTLSGRGSICENQGHFTLTARFDHESIPLDFVENHFKDMLKPRFYSREDFWRLQAETSSGVTFTCTVAPPHGWTDRGNGVTDIRCDIDMLTFTPKPPNAADILWFETLVKKHSKLSAQNEEDIKGCPDPPEPVPSKFHAILPEVQCVLAEHMTRIERQNAYLPTTTSEKRDTFVDENSERKIALIEENGNLHVYLELATTNQSDDVENKIFTALLDAVAFTHGCQPYPQLKEHSRDGRIVCCELRSITNLELAMFKPLRKNAVYIQSGARVMLGVAFEFFQREEAIVTRIRKAMWLYRDAASKEVPLPIQVLTACTLFEGLVKYLFDAHDLKAPTKNGKPAAIFKGNKETAKKLLMEKHRETCTEGDAETDWSRMAGYLNSCDYVRTKERIAAVAQHFGFPWENDIEQVHEIWNRHRNALAHGSEVKDDYHSINLLFQAWSRLSGATHRFVLAEMGYVGTFSYSPMEAGLEEMNLTAKP
jgi:hypothetical protein